MNRIIFLAINVLLLWLTFRGVAGECHKVKSTDTDSVWIYCPDLEYIEMTMEVKFGKFLDINCQNNKSYDISSIDIDVGEINDIQSYKCNLVNILPIIFSKWNITQVKYLKIIGFTEDEFVLNKKQFENMDVSTIEKIEIINSNITDIEEDTFEDFVNLTAVTLNDNKIKRLKDLFKNSKKLELLEAASNGLETLPDQITAPELVRLLLWNNNLSEINDSFFNTLKNLEVLELSGNKIENLSENLFNPLSKLKQISLRTNKITKIPDNLFKTNLLLEDIRFPYLNLSSIPENLFKGMNKLKTLHLYETELKSLKENTFVDLINLETLLLHDNYLDELPENIFANTVNLKKLNLSRNQLSQWTKGHSKNLKSLDSLDLSGNNLSKIYSGAFAKLTELTNLDLSTNNIDYIQSQTFSGLRELTKIDLSYNKLTYNSSVFETYLRHLQTVETLLLHHNKFREIPEFLSWIGVIQELDLSFNELQALDVNDVMGIKTVALEGNKIEFIDFGLADHSLGIDNVTKDIKQTTIKIANNSLNCDCAVYSLLKYFNKKYNEKLTKAITLDGDIRCSVPGARFGQNIRNLQLENFTCDYIGNYKCPDKCQCYISPYKQNLIVNCTSVGFEVPPQLSPFKVLPIHIGTLTGFVIDKCVVDLRNNSLTNFIENRDSVNYANVSELYLSHNDLRFIDWLPRNLRTLELNDNRLVNLGYKAIHSLNSSRKLGRLTLEHNAWKCNCQLANLTKMIKTQYQNIPQDDLILCEDGRRLTDLTAGALCYFENQVLIIVLCSLLFIFLLLIGTLFVLYYKYEYHVKVWLYSKAFFKRFVAEEELDKDKIFDAFLSYSHKDEDFVVEHLIPELENGPEHYKLCVHARDWIIGEFITKQIINSVSDSRRTIIVLSKHFIESEWATMEFRTAHVQAMKEGRHRLIVILYDDVDPKSIQDEELRAYLTTNTYVKWGDPWFWKKLKYVMPHKHRDNVPRKFRSRKMENIMVTIDKMDLINSPTTPNTGTPPAVSMDPLLLKNGGLNFKPSTKIETPPAESGL